MPKKKRNTAEIVCDIRDGSDLTRRAAIRELCPCRNNERDLETWRKIFQRARFGGRGERRSAAHTIGTLLEKATYQQEWRDLLRALQDDLDALMADPRSASTILGVVKGHGHQRRGTASQNYRRCRRALDLGTPDDLAEWVNAQLELSGPRRVSANDPGVHRLWRWQRHRVRFQPNRRTKEGELLAKVQQFVTV